MYLPRRPEPLDRAAATASPSSLRRHRPRPARVEHLQPLDPVPFDLGLELPGDGLHLGQLGHPSSTTC